MDENGITNKLDAIKEQSSQVLVAIAQLQEQVKGLPDHETRIRSLEHWRWGYTGLVAVATTFVTAWTATKGAP